MTQKVKAAIIGSGNIGTDLMMKIMRHGQFIEMAALVGIDSKSDGLEQARQLGVVISSKGISGLIDDGIMSDIELVFDATSASAHIENDRLVRTVKPGVKMVDLTPAAIGPYCVPVVNLTQHLDEPNVNMVTCGGQATIPIVAAVSSVAEVHYAEIIASISSRSAGPGTRANIDEFTETTSRGIEVIGGARKGKAIIVLNPAEPPMLMRDTVYVLSSKVDTAKIEQAVEEMVASVNAYVPGYRLKQRVQFEEFGPDNPCHISGVGQLSGIKTTVFLQVEGAAHYLPSYAGNLDIMTSAALATGEKLAERLLQLSPSVA
jgi:acetaldehyde dehydrogenase